MMTVVSQTQPQTNKQQCSLCLIFRISEGRTKEREKEMKGVKKARCFFSQKNDQKEASKEMNEEKEKEKLSTTETKQRISKAFPNFPNPPVLETFVNTNTRTTPSPLQLSLLSKAPLR